MLSLPASGALIVHVSDATMTQQGTGFVDVFLTGEAGDTLGMFGYEFSITGATAQSGDLQFSLVQSLSEQTVSTPTPYVFFGDTDPGFINSVRGGDAVTLLGGDSLASLDSVPVDGTFLLARLELKHEGTLLTPTHDFIVSLNALSPFTFFDRDFDPGTTDPGFENYSTFGSLSGTVTVSATAVPEPSGMVLLGTIGIAGYLSRRRRLRRRTPESVGITQ